jgi:2-amino-4-hydroxy-6-hydroxymethyldihydropteridine diphosphokinase
MSAQERRQIAVIGLGANVGEPRAQLETAFATLAQLPDTHLLRRSSFYRTAPMGKADQPDFINAVAMITTGLSAVVLLAHLIEIEHKQGRRRTEKNGPRTLDLDLLLYGDDMIDEPGLAVPHPRMHQRRFVLEPLLELNPDCNIPGRGRAADWLARITDPAQTVERIKG